KDRQITHNSMFADFLHRQTSPMKSTTTLSKIAILPPVQSKTRPSPIKSDQDRLVSSQEKNTNPTQGTVRFRGIPKINDQCDSSTKIQPRVYKMNTKGGCTGDL